MTIIKPRILTLFALVALLAGCAATPGLPPRPSENLVVPPVANRIGVLSIKQVYALQQPTAMNAINAGNTQPEIHLPYDQTKDGPPPAEALERVALQPWGTVTQEVTELQTDSNGQTSWVTCYETDPVNANWGQKTLGAGTQIAVSSIEIYSNSHVYRGRILTGFARNCFVLLVVPVGDVTIPTLADLQVKDSGYLIPTLSARTSTTQR
jgi:hypothetical protein